MHVLTILAQTNDNDHSLSSFLINENQFVRVHLEVAIELITLNDIPSSDIDSVPSIDEELMQEVCDLTWWENRIQNEVALVNYLVQDDQDFLTLYNTCDNGNMPIHLAAQAGVSLRTVNLLLGRSALNYVYDTLDQKNHQGQTPSDIMTENNHQVPTVNIAFSLFTEENNYRYLLRDIEPDEDEFDFLNIPIPQR